MRAGDTPREQPETASEAEGPTIADLEAQLRQARAQTASLEARLEQAQQADTVVAISQMVAHDINNLLGAVMGFASVLKLDLEPTGTAREDLKEIEAACLKASTLTQKLMKLAQRAPVKLERVELQPLFRAVVSDDNMGLEKGARLRARVEPDHLAVDGDAGQLKNLLSCLCQNAADATAESGQIALSAEAITLSQAELAGTPKLTPGRFVRLTVQDDGTGMDDASAKRAFKPFFTTRSRDDREGLGLAFVFGTVRRHGGRVVLASTPGAGTVVTIDLPRPAEPGSATTAGGDVCATMPVTLDEPS